MFSQLQNLVGLLRLSALLETILEPPSHGLHVAHTSSTGGPPSLRLLSPVVLAGLGSRVSAAGAGLLLDVVRGLSAATANCVRLVVPLSERSSSLSHCIGLFCEGVEQR